MLFSDNAEKILLILKRKGSQTVNTFAPMLKMTTVGVRQHLLSLEKESLVESKPQAVGVGRPQRVWQLTEKAIQRFPNTHANLTVELLDSVKTLFGEEGIEQIIVSREKTMFKKYKLALQTSKTLLDKIKQLVKLRSVEGYMAEYQCNKDGSYLVLENHCPICAAASRCQLFCRSELELFQALLGKQVQIQRESHILAGARRCAYLIQLLSV